MLEYSATPRPRHAIKKGEINGSSTSVKIVDFLQLMLDLRETDKEAFFAHCANCCGTLAEAVKEIEDYAECGDPRDMAGYSVHQWQRHDIDARFKAFMPGDWSAVYNQYHYIILEQQKKDLVTAVVTLALLTPEGQLYDTEVYIATEPLHPMLKLRSGERIQTMNPEKLLYLVYEQAGVTAHQHLQELGMSDLTEIETWSVIDRALCRSSEKVELPEDFV